MHLLPVILLAVTAAAAVSDLSTGKISNWLSYSVAALALVLHSLVGPLPGLVALVVMVGVLAAGFPIFAFGLLRGGDVKMIVACCGLVSFHFFWQFILYTMLAGGLVALTVAWRSRTLKQSFASVGTMLHPLLIGAAPSALPFNATKIPYGVAIFGGACVTALAMTNIPALRL
jgi:prepilin peptidase CpaA